MDKYKLIRITGETHKELKLLATEQNTSILRLVERIFKEHKQLKLLD